MSDEKTAGDIELEKVHRCLRFNSIFFWIGILIMAAGFLTDFLKLEVRINTGILLLVAWLFLGGTRIISVISGGFRTIFQPDYITVTTYSDGSKSYDSGSIFSRLLSRIIGILVAFFIGPFVTCIHLIILIFKYLIYKVVGKGKTTLVPSGLIIIIIDIIFITAFITLIIFTWFVDPSQLIQQ